MEHPTRKQMNDENFTFLKDLYFDLIICLLKKKDTKSVEFLQNSWKEIEIQYADVVR